MLLHRLKISGVLSFGPHGIDLPMERLNVLIGPNGSGKSNLLEVLALLRAAPREIAEPVKRGGGVWEWLWKGDAAPDKASLEAIVEDPHGQRHVCHELQFVDHGGRFEVTDERIEYAGGASTRQESEFTYRLQGGRHTFTVCPLDGGRDVSFGDEWSVGDNGRAVGGPRERAKPEQSVLSQLRDASRYPALHCLQEQYEQIRLYRDWSFGPSATLRRNQSAHDRADFLLESGENAALVLSGFRGKHKRDLVETLQELFDGIVDFTCEVKGGTVSVFLEERNGRQIPATRLSDGTLRYLCLLAILLHPEPPSLVAIEEPEMGLHPDVVAHVAQLLVDASQRTQIVVTTHSRMLVDALSDCPSSVVVCEQENGESRFERLDGTRLTAWLDDYSLGDLWGRGELGGNRW